MAQIYVLGGVTLLIVITVTGLWVALQVQSARRKAMQDARDAAIIKEQAAEDASKQVGASLDAVRKVQETQQETHHEEDAKLAKDVRTHFDSNWR